MPLEDAPRPLAPVLLVDMMNLSIAGQFADDQTAVEYGKHTNCADDLVTACADTGQIVSYLECCSCC